VLLELQWHKEQELVAELESCETLADTLMTLADEIVTGIESVQGPGVARDMLSIYARRPEWLPLDEQPFPTARLVEKRFAESALFLLGETGTCVGDFLLTGVNLTGDEVSSIASSNVAFGIEADVW